MAFVGAISLISLSVLVFIFAYLYEHFNRLARKAIEAMSLADELTGLYNRRGLNAMMAQVLRMAVRSKKPVAIVYADLDEFKSINDRLGHTVGDKALKEFSEIIKGSLRASDIVSRVGGDEFVIVLIELSSGDAARVIDRLKESVAQKNTENGRVYDLKVSFGVVWHNPLVEQFTTEELLEKADEAMYRRKRGGGRT